MILNRSVCRYQITGYTVYLLPAQRPMHLSYLAYLSKRRRADEIIPSKWLQNGRAHNVDTKQSQVKCPAPVFLGVTDKLLSNAPIFSFIYH